MRSVELGVRNGEWRVKSEEWRVGGGRGYSRGSVKGSNSTPSMIPQLW